MPGPEVSSRDALRGPWVAVISDAHGEVYRDLTDAVAELGYEGSVDIAVVRGTAAPDPDVIGASMPGSYASGDVLYEIGDVYLSDPDDPSVGAEHRWIQAKAVAAALNAAQTRPWVVARDGGRTCETCDQEITRGEAYEERDGVDELHHVRCPDPPRPPAKASPMTRAGVGDG
jgi:hypothetical protein